MFETMVSTLDRCGEIVEVLLNGLSLVCILAGVVAAIMKSVERRRHDPGDHPLHTRFRLVFGGWLVVALEFQLAADIVSTIVSPTTQHLIELGAIAIIRTFLNYFLSKELQEENETLRVSEKTKTMTITK